MPFVVLDVKGLCCVAEENIANNPVVDLFYLPTGLAAAHLVRFLFILLCCCLWDGVMKVMQVFLNYSFPLLSPAATQVR